MILKISRIIELENSTLGKFKLYEDPTRILLAGSTIERAGPDTTESGQDKRIPEGEYNTIQRMSPKFNMITPLLFNKVVSKDRYILIHKGNSYKDLEGCIALGQSDNGKDFIYKSKVTINKFLDIIKDKDLIVKISNDFTSVTEGENNG